MDSLAGLNLPKLLTPQGPQGALTVGISQNCTGTGTTTPEPLIRPYSLQPILGRDASLGSVAGVQVVSCCTPAFCSGDLEVNVESV
jgi:hypothetical protein